MKATLLGSMLPALLKRLGIVNDMKPHPLLLKTCFITAIKERKVCRVWYYAQKYQKVISRLVFPLDYGRSQWGDIRFHMWDSDRRHVVSVLPDNVERVVIQKRQFNTNFIDWKPAWSVKRKW